MQTIDLDASMLALVHLAEHSTGAALSQLAWDRGRKADSSIAIFDEMGGSTPRTRFLCHSPERRIMEANVYLKRAHRTLTLLQIRANT